MNKVHLYGLPRSGGTYIWQIFREIFPELVSPQTHTFKMVSQDYTRVLVIRDPREVAFSHWRIHFGEYDDEGNLLNKPDNERLLGCVHSVKLRLMQFYCYMNTKGRNLILRYENFVDNPEYVLDTIEEEFDIKIDLKKRAEIMEKTSIKNNLKKSLKLAKENKSFNHYDNSDHIHSHHINTPLPGEYKKYLSDEQLVELNKQLEFELNFLKYK